MIDSPSDFIILILFAFLLKMACDLFDEVFNSVSAWNTRWRDSMRCRIWKGNIPSYVISMRNQRTTQRWGMLQAWMVQICSNISRCWWFQQIYMYICIHRHRETKCSLMDKWQLDMSKGDKLHTLDVGCWGGHRLHHAVKQTDTQTSY